MKRIKLFLLQILFSEHTFYYEFNIKEIRFIEEQASISSMVRTITIIHGQVLTVDQGAI